MRTCHLCPLIPVHAAHPKTDPTSPMTMSPFCNVVKNAIHAWDSIHRCTTTLQTHCMSPSCHVTRASREHYLNTTRHVRKHRTFPLRCAILCIRCGTRPLTQSSYIHSQIDRQDGTCTPHCMAPSEETSPKAMASPDLPGRHTIYSLCASWPTHRISQSQCPTHGCTASLSGAVATFAPAPIASPDEGLDLLLMGLLTQCS